jgi:predicted permease
MRVLTRIRHAVRALFRARQVDRDIHDELTDWVETLTERHLAKGLTREEARRAALIELGGFDRVKDEARAMRPRMRLDTLAQDIRYAWRALRRSPGVAAAVAITFALGVGANTAIFSVVKAVLIEPLPYSDPDRLMFVWADITDLGYPRAPLSGPELADLQAGSTLFEKLGGVWSTTSNLTGDGDPEQLRIATVTPDFFPLLGVQPLHGEVISAKHFGQPVRPVLLSHALWTRRYGGDPSVVGRTITMNDRPALVVGVMPASFALLFPSDSAIPPDLQAWVPGGARPQTEPRGQQYLRVVGRLRPGVSIAEAQQEVSAIGAEIVRRWPSNYTPNYRFYSVPMQADTVSTVKPALVALFAGVGILLVIACVNVAGLLIVRAASRRREAAVRLALGAGRLRLLRQYLVEGLVLSALGGAIGVLLATVGLHVLIAMAPDSLPRVHAAEIDAGVLGFAAIIAVAWGVLFSLAPMSETLRVHISAILQHAGRAAGFVLHQRTRRALVVAQIALGVLLLVGAALLARAFDRLMRIDTGFSADRVMTFRVAVPFSRYPSLAAQNVFNQQIKEALAAVPGAESVGAISHLPYDNLPNWGTPYLPEGEVDPARAGLADARNVAPGFFETVRARLIAGRFFTEDDGPNQREVAVVVDDVFAARVWPGQDPVGRALRIDARLSGEPTSPARVIGVVGHLRHRSLTDPGREQIFVSSRQVLRNPVAFVVRASGEPTALTPAIRAAVSKLDPRLPVYDLRPLDDYLAGARAASRFTVLLAVAFAVVALLLAGVGVYGVIAYSVSVRRREFGIRLALGALPGQIRGLVLGDGLRLAAVGLGIGLVAALGVSRLLQSQLYETAPHDPVAYTGAVAALGLAAVLACWLPMRRAAQAQPQVSLRED